MSIKIHNCEKKKQKKRGLISWLVLEKMQQVANTPDVGHGDDVMVWHASSQ